MSRETAADFLAKRRDFLYVHVEPSPAGSGFDVVLRLDGTYTHRGMAERVAEGMKRMLGDMIPSDRRDWWEGPPK